MKQKFQLINFFLVFWIIFLSKNAFSDNKKDLICNYFSSLKTFQASFVQKTLDKKFNLPNQSGKIWISKSSNSIAVEYKSENADLKMVSKNGIVKLLDRQTKQLTHIGNKNNDLLIILSKDFDCSQLEMTKVYSFEKTGLYSCIKMKDEDNNLHNICFYFNKNDNELILKSIIDESINGGFEISFEKIILNKEISKDIFILKDPRIFDDE